MKIVTISREFGSGGRELGKRLADAIGFAYYDKEIINAIAEKSKLDPRYVANIMEKGLTPNIPLTFGRSFYAPMLVQGDEIKVLIAQQEIIKELALGRDCVIVGRNANVILKDRMPMNLFVYADMESKIKRCRQRANKAENLSEREMEKKIRQIDAGRAKHQQLFTSDKWGAKENYHLCINTTGMNIKMMIPAIAEYVQYWLNRESIEESFQGG